MHIEEKENSNVYNQNRNLKLQEYRYQVQGKKLTILLNSI